MPLRNSVRGVSGKGRGLCTMSSGSSGSKVTVPDPSLSTSCLMRRMLGNKKETMQFVQAKQKVNFKKSRVV